MKERKMMNFHFRHRAILNSISTSASIDNHNIIGNTQEYLISLYISKMYLFVGDIHVCM